MYSLQKKLLELESVADNLNAETERKLLLENLRELREAKSNFSDFIAQISSSEAPNVISKITENNILGDRGMPYVNINKEEALVLQDLKSRIFEEFSKSYTSENEADIHELLELFQNKNMMEYLRDLEDSKFFLNTFANNVSIFMDAIQGNLQVDESHPINTSLSSCSSITVDFENCKNNPHIAASSPVPASKETET